MSVELAERLYEAVNAALRGERGWVGLGLESVPGKPFGWAFEQERAAIRRHIHAKMKHCNDGPGSRRFWATHRGLGVEWAISRVQDRLHRSHPTYRERQEAWKRRAGPRPKAPEPFSVEELERLVELFEGANDPLTAGIAVKARALIVAARA